MRISFFSKFRLPILLVTLSIATCLSTITLAGFYPFMFTSTHNYTVTFVSNGGSTVATQTVAYGALATAPTSTWANHTFVNWYREAGLVNVNNFSTPVTASITLYAKWNTNTWIVYFEENSGSTVSDQTVVNGSLATSPTSTRTGYTFGGWYTTSGLTTLYNFSTAVTSSFTLYAKWTINSYTVTFDSSGGSAVSSQSVAHGGVATTPTAPTRTCYTFNGWHTGSSTGPSYVFASTPVTANITLYAGWTINTYTATFNANGGTGGTGPTTYNCGATVSVPTPTRSCYTFAGWSSYPNPITYTFTSTASWTLNTYTATFNANGGTGGTGPTTYNCGATVSVPTPTRSGYTFTGWSSYPNPITYTFTSTASWSFNHYCDASFSRPKLCTGTATIIIANGSCPSATCESLCRTACVNRAAAGCCLVDIQTSGGTVVHRDCHFYTGGSWYAGINNYDIALMCY